MWLLANPSPCLRLAIGNWTARVKSSLPVLRTCVAPVASATAAADASVPPAALARVAQAPHLKSLPVFAFGKNEVVRNQLATGCSPGAVYKVYDGLAKQVEACRPSTPAFGFGTASRFPDASKADRQAHRDYVRHMRKSAMQRQRPQSAASILSGA